MLFEKIWPYLLAAAIGSLWYFLGLDFPSDPSILSASITLGAILTGFLATSKAILMTLDSPIMQRIRGTDYINLLTAYLAQAIWWSFGDPKMCIPPLNGMPPILW